jgi:hypothetical protein
VEDFFPLILAIGPARWTEATVSHMAVAYEGYFRRGERYALISGGGGDISARERRALGQWADSPRVREKSRELCVGSATITRSAIARGALTALLWVWKPASPHHVSATSEDAVDWCLQRISDTQLRLPRSRDLVRREAILRLGEP